MADAVVPLMARTAWPPGRLEALRRNAQGFRNLINYRIRSLLHCGALAL